MSRLRTVALVVLGTGVPPGTDDDVVLVREP
jgi:hypothetical protein